MIRSLFSAVSALRNHQQAMDVIANNLANINTAGFKAGRADFQDALYQTLSGAAAPVTGGLGGINPVQVGLGMNLAGIDTFQTQGSLQNTGRTTDLAIQGNGFFVVSDGVANYYTRDGSFDLDSAGTIIDPASGMKLLGIDGNPITVDMTTYASFTIAPNGIVTGVSAAGVSTPLGTIALQNFANPSGLTKVGGNLFQPSVSSGFPTGFGSGATGPGAPQANGRGQLTVGAIEMSNVDVSREVSMMIVTQRGFQANSKVVTTSDEMLQDLINLKR